VEIEEVDGNTVMHVILDGQLLGDFAMASVENQLAGFGAGMDVVIEVEFV